MDYISCMINFTLGQKVVVKKDSHTEILDCENIDKLPKMMYNISKEKEINKIVLGGNNDFTHRVGQDIQELSLANFDKTNLEITYLS